MIDVWHSNFRCLNTFDDDNETKSLRVKRDGTDQRSTRKKKKKKLAMVIDVRRTTYIGECAARNILDVD